MYIILSGTLRLFLEYFILFLNNNFVQSVLFKDQWIFNIFFSVVSFLWKILLKTNLFSEIGLKYVIKGMKDIHPSVTWLSLAKLLLF